MPVKRTNNLSNRSERPFLANAEPRRVVKFALVFSFYLETWRRLTEVGYVTIRTTKTRLYVSDLLCESHCKRDTTMRAASSEYFIVKPKSTGFSQGLPIQEIGSTGLFILRSPSAGDAARAQWDRLVQQFGDQLDFIAPVLIDDRGQQQLPTGEIVVQFHTLPSKSTLHSIEETYGLRCLKTN